MNTTLHQPPRSRARFRGVASMPSRKAFWYLALIVNLVLTVSSPAQNARPTESQVKAAYLYNFGKFVRWQVERIAKSDSLELCILGKDPFGPILDSTVEGQSIDGRKITVRRVANVSESMQCSILFISASEEGRLGGILSAAQRFGTLTVSDIPHFADRGGVIGFVLREDRIRFEVNRGAAEQSHLTLSSELLKVASKVMEKSPPQG